MLPGKIEHHSMYAVFSHTFSSCHAHLCGDVGFIIISENILSWQMIGLSSQESSQLPFNLKNYAMFGHVSLPLLRGGLTWSLWCVTWLLCRIIHVWERFIDIGLCHSRASSFDLSTCVLTVNEY